MNAIGSLYGDREWHSFAGRFLEGSNELAAIPIPGIDYKTPENQQIGKGYYGALTDAVKAGLEGRRLTVEMLLGWQRLILEEMQQKGALKEIIAAIKPDEIKSFVEGINAKLSEKNRSEAEIVSLVAEIMSQIELNNLFAPDSKRMEHLTMNYLMSYFKTPIVIFTGGDRDTYLSSINNKFKMSLLLAEKVRDAVFVQGVLMKKVGGKHGSDWYKAEGSTAKKDLVVEWHVLLAAAKQWQAALTS